MEGRPDYPALKVGDFEVVGEPIVDSTTATVRAGWLWEGVEGMGGLGPSILGKGLVGRVPEPVS